MTDNSTLRFQPWLIMLGCVVALGPLAIDMYLPAFPAIEQGFGRGAQLTLSSFFIGLVLGQLFYGPISDRIGRRRPILFGLAVYSLASFSCIFASSLNELTAMRFLQALGACGGMVLSRAIVRDRCEIKAAAQAQSQLLLVMGLAPILAPAAGGALLLRFDWQAIFIAQAIAGSIALVWAWFSLRESHHPQHRTATLSFRGVMRTYGELVRERRFMGFTLSSGLVMTGMFAYIAGSPSVLISLKGLSPQHYSLAFGMNAAGFITASQINARLLRHFETTRILNHALWFPMLASVTMIICETSGHLPLAVLMALLFIFIGSLGFIAPNAGAAALATQGQRAGTAASLQGSLQFLLATLVSAWLAGWHRSDAIPLATVMSLCGCGAFIANRWMLKRH